MSVSFHSIFPAVGFVMVANIRINVDLPAPLGTEQSQHARTDLKCEVV